MTIETQTPAKPTIHDIARIAGVSTATVSRTLSQPDRVQLETRERVMAAVQQTGYRANSVARNLRTQRTNAILVLAPNLANTFFSQIISAITDVAAANGYGVLIADSAPQGNHAANIVQLSADGRADGVISLDGALDPLRITRSKLPLVMACEWSPDSDLPSVTINNAEGTHLAIQHLTSLGHTKIAHISGPADNVLSKARKQGWRDALHALQLPTSNCFDGDFTLKSGAEAAKLWLATAPDQRATAVFCASDECALGFIGHVTHAGLTVPDDVSVVGFDDVELAEHFMPSLTTIHQPRERIGKRAAEMLIRLMRGQDASPSDAETLPVTLVIRGSTGPV